VSQITMVADPRVATRRLLPEIDALDIGKRVAQRLRQHRGTGTHGAHPPFWTCAPHVFLNSLCAGNGRPSVAFQLCNRDARPMKLLLVTCFVLSLAACSGPRLPAPNTAEVRYDARNRAVQVMISGLQPASEVTLVSGQGSRYPASVISPVSGPHVLYNPPPSLSLGIGGFGFSGCCSGLGLGIGTSVPVGRPTPAEVSDQYVASALIPVPPDYATNWASYRLQVSVGNQSIMLAAPPPPA